MDVFKFNNIMDEFKVGDVVEFLNEFYYIIDSIIDMYDIYKVNVINDVYMVVLGNVFWIYNDINGFYLYDENISIS